MAIETLIRFWALIIIINIYIAKDKKKVSDYFFIAGASLLLAITIIMMIIEVN